MNHEFWNEIGNLYFMCGAYEPAIHAYLRSIKMENTFGRPYSNLALAYVQLGKYGEAIKLYRRSIELLSDKQEKAATWNRLGSLFRKIKDYNSALEAYQRADLIMPQGGGEKPPKISAEATVPLSVSLPEIDLGAILAKGSSRNLQLPDDLLSELNAELGITEVPVEDSVFEELMTPPGFEDTSQTEDVVIETIANTQSEWRHPHAEEVLLAEESPIFISEKEPNILIPAEFQDEVGNGDIEAEISLTMEPEPEPEQCYASEVKIVNETVFEEIPVPHEEDGLTEYSQSTITQTDLDATEYQQSEYILTDLSSEEQQALNLEIIKYQQATTNNPRRYILWESLGEAYKSAGQYKDAIFAFQKAISLNPTNPMCHYRLGLVYAAEKKEDEAIRSFKKVLELNPNLPQAHASLASQYRKMGLLETAQSHIEKARAMQVEGESDYNHACLEAICGNDERALKLLEIALRAKQTYVAWVQNDPDFHSLHGDSRFHELLSSYAINV